MSNQENTNISETKKEILEQVGQAVTRAADNERTVKVILQENNADFQYEKQKVEIKGTINVPLIYLQQRHELIDQKKAHVLINREAMTIEVVVDEENHFKHHIGGKLEIHPDFKKFGINSSKSYEPEQLGDFIKMNRAFFPDKATAMALVTKLKNFKAKVDKDIEKQNDNRANISLVRKQAVETNIPESFQVSLPLFKGEKAQMFEVEIYIDPNTFACTLISPEAQENMQYTLDAAIDEQKQAIAQLTPGIAIFEQ